jgi:predicted nucleotidyltransferase
MQEPNIHFDVQVMAALCRRFRVKRLALFGSVLREDFNPESDVDVLYEFDDDAVIGWDIVDFEHELSKLFGGRRVDLVPFKHISPFIRKRVLAEAQIACAA